MPESGAGLHRRRPHGFASDERFGSSQQSKRAAVSVAANIAEGCGRETRADLALFLVIARGSASECERHIVTASRLGFADEFAAEALIDGLITFDAWSTTTEWLSANPDGVKRAA